MRTFLVLAAIGLGLSRSSTASAEVKLELNTDRPRLLELAKRLPNLDTYNSACPSFDAEIQINLAEGGYQLDFQFRPSDSMQFLARDRRDGSPCILYRGSRIAVFDPVAPQVILADAYKVAFSFMPDATDRPNCGISAGFGKEHHRRLQFNIAGVMQLPGKLVDLGSKDDCIHLELRRDNGGREVTKLLIEEHRAVCLHESWSAGEVAPSMTQKFTIHVADESLLFKELEIEKLQSVLQVRTTLMADLKGRGTAGVAEQMATFGLVSRSGFAHVALWQPGLREEFKIPLVTMPDWNTVAKSKQEFGPLLRDLYGLPEWAPASDDAPLAPTFAAEVIENKN